MSPTATARAGLIAALGAAIAYGVNAPFAPLAAAAGIGGPDLVFWRVLGMLGIIAALAAVTRKPFLPPRDLLPGLATLAVATATTTIGYITALTRIPVGVAVIVFYTFPLIILILTPFLERTRLSMARLGVFALAFGGLAVALGPAFGGLDTLGLVLAGIAACGTAAQILISSRLAQRLDAATLILAIHVGVLPLAFVAALATGGPSSPLRLADAAGPVAVNVIGYVIAYLLQVRAVRLGRPAAVGLALTLEPVVSTAAAAWLLGERLASTQYVGAVMVLGAILASIAVEQRDLARAGLAATDRP